ncbi:MAG: TetR family transcriptional regulator [Cyanobacteria bacterium RYN_339]|nr:TetR family transcriptional regulator [Cyanobacteria bacterium RYN_339]
MATTKPGRPRCEASRQKILHAALAALDAHGVGGLTVDGIAARAGVGKATIYRWWPNKSAVVMEAFLADMDPRIAFEDTGTLRGDLKVQMRRLLEVIRTQRGQKMLALISQGHADPEIAHAFLERWILPRRAVVRGVLQRGLTRGELRADADLEMAIDALYGPLWFRLLLGFGTVDGAYADALADHVLAGLAPR